MTADERIEKLLNRFGQTIEDLPKASDDFPYDYAYSKESKNSARRAALVFAHDRNGFNVLADYICHLADVIDRMEAALETAARWGDCFVCSGFGRDCMADNPCEKFEMSDAYLS